MPMSIRATTLAASVAALLAGTSLASAGGFALREQSASAQGQSFAGAASGTGRLSSMFWNPAVITMAPGWQSENHIAAIIPYANIKPLPPTPTLGLGPSGDIGEDALVPASYSSYQVNDRIWLGLANTGPFGLVTEPRPVWAGQTYARTSEVFSFNVNPILGIKVNDWLSIAAGPQFQYISVRLRQAVPRGPALALRPTALTPLAPSGGLEGDDIGVGFTAGVLFTPFVGTQIGVGYRSSINHDLEGKAYPAFGVTVDPIRAKLNTPEIITVGLTQRVTNELTMSLGYEFQNWSRLRRPAVRGPADAILSELAFNYKDGHFYSLGAEYQLTPSLAIRAGVAYEDSPVTDRVRTPRLPDNDRIWASVGASYQWNEKITFDLAYTHIFVKNTPISILPGSDAFNGVPFVADVDANVNIISAALRYRWDNPKVAVSAPIVTKY